MEPQSYMRSVVDRNVVMRRISVLQYGVYVTYHWKREIDVVWEVRT